MDEFWFIAAFIAILSIIALSVVAYFKSKGKEVAEEIVERRLPVKGRGMFRITRDRNSDGHSIIDYTFLDDNGEQIEDPILKEIMYKHIGKWENWTDNTYWDNVKDFDIYQYIPKTQPKDLIPEKISDELSSAAKSIKDEGNSLKEKRTNKEEDAVVNSKEKTKKSKD